MLAALLVLQQPHCLSVFEFVLERRFADDQWTDFTVGEIIKHSFVRTKLAKIANMTWMDDDNASVASSRSNRSNASSRRSAPRYRAVDNGGADEQLFGSRPVKSHDCLNSERGSESGGGTWAAPRSNNAP